MPAGIYSPTLRANPNPNMYGIRFARSVGL